MPRKKGGSEKVTNLDTSSIFSRNKSYMSLAYGVIAIVVIFVVVFFVIRAISQRDSGVTDDAGQTAQERVYVVKEGDSLWTIAEEVYNDGFAWTLIAEANNLESPDAIEVGMELVIPVNNEIVPETEEQEEEVMEEESVEPTATVVPTEAAMQEESGETKDGAQGVDSTIAGESYTVVSGDSLWTIAVRAYGDGFKWVEIARANSDKINNPDLIYPDQEFVLPR